MTPLQPNRPCITLATTRQPHIHTRRAHMAKPMQATAQSPTSRQRAATTTASQTTRRPHPVCSKTNPASDMPATARPRQQRLTITGCAHAGLRRKDPTAHTSSTRQPRTQQRRQQQKKPIDQKAEHKTANTTMHQPNRCSNNDATINRPHASRPTLNHPGMQG